MTSKIEKFAAQLAQAEATQVGIDPLTVVDPEITVDEAYYIQLENIKKKLSEGQKIVGKKIGLTSVAVQKMLGVDEPDYGHLLDSMVVENGGTIDTRLGQAPWLGRTTDPGGSNTRRGNGSSGARGL